MGRESLAFPSRILPIYNLPRPLRTVFLQAIRQQQHSQCSATPDSRITPCPRSHRPLTLTVAQSPSCAFHRSANFAKPRQIDPQVALRFLRVSRAASILSAADHPSTQRPASLDCSPAYLTPSAPTYLSTTTNRTTDRMRFRQSMARHFGDSVRNSSSLPC